GVTRQGQWLTSRDVRRMLDDGVGRETGDHAALLADPSVGGLVRLGDDGRPARGGSSMETLDVIFPLIHGGYGEKRKLQVLLEMADLPYVGSGVLGSAVGMDKEVGKRLFAAAGIPVVPSRLVRAHAWAHGAAALLASIEREIGYPCFVKPSGQG